MLLHDSPPLARLTCQCCSTGGHVPQVVMAAAAAAGLNRNGIRRTAFSTGDLQALSVLPTKNSPSPPDPANVNLHRYSLPAGLLLVCSKAYKPLQIIPALLLCCWVLLGMTFWLSENTEILMCYSADALLICRTISSSSVSAQPSLATVPEGSTINTGLSASMPAVQYSSEALVQTEDLSSMSVEELQAELIRTRQAFHSAGYAHPALCFCVCYQFAPGLLSLCVPFGPP